MTSDCLPPALDAATKAAEGIDGRRTVLPWRFVEVPATQRTTLSNVFSQALLARMVGSIRQGPMAAFIPFDPQGQAIHLG